MRMGDGTSFFFHSAFTSSRYELAIGALIDSGMPSRNVNTFLIQVLYGSIAALILLTSCNTKTTSSTPTQNQPVVSPTATSIPSPLPPRLLTICMGQEPSSLFLYADSSIAARNIRQAIYDGPFDLIDYQYTPVILEEAPSSKNGGILIEPVMVEVGNLIVDGNEEISKLGEGTTYLPPGCDDASCAVTYSGQEPISLDQMVVRFRIRADMQWSDGRPLTADDSQFSFEIAQGLYPRALSSLISLTQSYTALDETTVEWRGLPGYRTSSYAENFFTPLPRHAWGSTPPEDLLVSEISNRSPIGWGAYIIDEWISDDHITLSRNTKYYRSQEGLPYFDKLVFRFVPDGDQALSALMAGECDYLDETTHTESQINQLLELQEADKLELVIHAGVAWEQITFGISSLNPTLPALFQSKEMRQSVAYCLNRQQIVDALFGEGSQPAQSYVISDHPLFNKDIKKYNFDPQAGMNLLESLGWLDEDNDPTTPRLSSGVTGIPDNTPLEFEFLTTTEEENQFVGKEFQASLSQCGFRVNISNISPSDLFASGPDGLIFGRKFSVAQFGWMSSNEPPCFQYTSKEIPGPYPEYSKGWGGANAGGYTNPEFDIACQLAIRTLPDDPKHLEAHYQAQSIFAEDLPAIPLYFHSNVIAFRPDMCNIADNLTDTFDIRNLETFAYGEGCMQ